MLLVLDVIMLLVLDVIMLLVLDVSMLLVLDVIMLLVLDVIIFKFVYIYSGHSAGHSADSVKIFNNTNYCKRRYLIKYILDWNVEYSYRNTL